LAKQVSISGKDLIRILERMGFEVVRINGSHHRLKHSDGRVTTVPVHGNENIPKGLLSKIIRIDIELDWDQLRAWMEKL
jgi:predicted RNA binding protein YcfA (HicA-like mRNA interferase family)